MIAGTIDVASRAMTDPAAKREAIIANADAFEAMLPLLVAGRRGEFALMRDRSIAGFFATPGEAQRQGAASFPDGLFSIQRVEDKAIDLGFYSHARYRRPA